jgi:DNA-binding transcriptional MerR regulator
MSVMNRKEAAAMCGVTDRTITSWLSKGKLSAERFEGSHGSEYDITVEALIECGLLKEVSSTVDSMVELPSNVSRLDFEGDFRVEELEEERDQLQRQNMALMAQATHWKNSLEEVSKSHESEILSKDRLIETLEVDRRSLLQLREDHLRTALEAGEWKLRCESAQREAEMYKEQLAVSQDMNIKIIEGNTKRTAWWKFWRK